MATGGWTGPKWSEDPLPLERAQLGQWGACWGDALSGAGPFGPHHKLASNLAIFRNGGHQLREDFPRHVLPEPGPTFSANKNARAPFKVPSSSHPRCWGGPGSGLLWPWTWTGLVDSAFCAWPRPGRGEATERQARPAPPPFSFSPVHAGPGPRTRGEGLRAGGGHSPGLSPGPGSAEATVCGLPSARRDLKQD